MSRFLKYFGIPTLFIGIIILDQWSKHLMLDPAHFFSSENLILKLYKNYGLAMGILSTSNEMIRNVTYSTVFALLFVIYLLTIYYIIREKKVLLLHLGLTFYMAGILGNVIDRIHLGFVIDFIVLQMGPFKKVAFNLADSFQLIGVGLSCFSFFYYYKELWFPENKRKLFLINFKEQFKFAFKFVITTISLSFILGLFSYSFLHVYLKALPLDERHLVTRSFFVGYFLITLLFTMLIFLITLIISHRNVGPIYAFRRFVQEWVAGKETKLKLRNDDYHQKELQEIASLLNSKKT